MDIQDSLRVCELIDNYGALLTDKQLNVCKNYFFDNLSLGEIGKEYNITRQAVNDCLEKSRNLLEKYESVVGKIELKNKLKQNLSELGQKYQMDNLTKDINKIIGNID